MVATREVMPQPGYQMKVLSSRADIVVSGAAAGVGKTYSLLLEFLRHIENPLWGGVIFRRTGPQITAEGGLWDTSMELYPYAQGEPRESRLEWFFRKGAKLKFSHLEYEKNILDWQGAQIPFIGFDELTHFTKKMFLYLLSRNRSVSGIKPYMRATCNPDPDSWVAELVAWWIDWDTGFPIPERNGVIRYFTVDGGKFIWGDTKAEVIEKAWYFLEKQVTESGIPAEEFIKSFTFISGSIYENRALLSVNPAYLANLNAQDEQTKMQLLEGNWKVAADGQEIYDYYAFKGMFDNVLDVSRVGNYITADIALEGSDKFVVGHWAGMELDDMAILDKNNGKDVINTITGMAKKHKTQNRHICYDNDGVGGFIEGFIPGAIPFKNGGTPLPNPDATTKEDKGKPENYFNLKTQCYYRSGRNVLEGNYKIAEVVAQKQYAPDISVRDRFIQERKAIKRGKKADDGKLCLIKKDEMKTYNNGQSPDLMDMLMMREYFNLHSELTVLVY